MDKRPPVVVVFLSVEASCCCHDGDSVSRTEEGYRTAWAASSLDDRGPVTETRSPAKPLTELMKQWALEIQGSKNGAFHEILLARLHPPHHPAAPAGAQRGVAARSGSQSLPLEHLPAGTSFLHFSDVPFRLSPSSHACSPSCSAAIFSVFDSLHSLLSIFIPLSLVLTISVRNLQKRIVNRSKLNLIAFRRRRLNPTAAVRVASRPREKVSQQQLFSTVKEEVRFWLCMDDGKRQLDAEGSDHESCGLFCLPQA